MRIWLDTDLGSDVDDALALGYALHHPEIELVGISTVFGDVDLRTKCVEALLDIEGEGSIPVLTGLGKPMTERRAGVMFGHEGRGLLDDPRPEMKITSESEDLQNERLEKLGESLIRTSPDCLVAIGPLTNLGALLANGIRLPPLAIMGGKSQDAVIPGMNDRIAEWNLFSDPVAARTVFESEKEEPALVAPAEVTFRTALETSDLDALTKGGPLCSMLRTLCDEWLRFLGEDFGTPEPRVALHDPLTLALLMEPSLSPLESRRVEVDDKGNLISVEGNANIKIATDVDLPALRSHLVETWVQHGG
ncbi:MAG: nucleoside hydrolase [Myxococcota bacterium]|nr:nucleoside hydrolase [Myxococcota bacterium]